MVTEDQLDDLARALVPRLDGLAERWLREHAWYLGMRCGFCRRLLSVHSLADRCG